MGASLLALAKSVYYLRAISKYKPLGAYIRRGDLTVSGFFALRVLGGLYMEGLIFGVLWYFRLIS